MICGIHYLITKLKPKLMSFHGVHLSYEENCQCKTFIFSDRGYSDYSHSFALHVNKKKSGCFIKNLNLLEKTLCLNEVQALWEKVNNFDIYVP